MKRIFFINRKNNLKYLITFIITVILFSGCGTKRIAPITGRKYRVYENSYSDYQMLNMVKSEYGQYVYSLGGDSKNKKETERVRRVASRLIAVTTEYLKNNGYANELKYYEWEIHLVPAPGQVNATCMPGGKIVVFEGILPIAYNDAGLAAILGHEIGHAIAHHSAENFTKQQKKGLWQTIGAVGLGVAGVAIGGDVETVSDVVNNTVQLSNQIMEFVEMKYSRKHEYEADHIGMVLMAMAGYDPREAPLVWQRMTQYYGDTQMRILSTHPSNKNRMKKMNEKWMGEALAYYKNSGSSQTNNYWANSQLSSNNGSKQSNSHPKSLTSQNQSVWKVTAGNLNVRNAPNTTTSSVIGSLKRGQKISVIEIKNGWAKINYNGKTGYVSSKFLIK